MPRKDKLIYTWGSVWCTEWQNMHITESGQDACRQWRNRPLLTKVVPHSTHIPTSPHPIPQLLSNQALYSSTFAPQFSIWARTLSYDMSCVQNASSLLTLLIFSHVWKWKITISRIAEMSTLQHICPTNFYFWSKAVWVCGPFPSLPNRAGPDSAQSAYGQMEEVLCLWLPHTNICTI